MSLTIDRLAAEDWAVLRELRLAALAEAPYAFWATLADESAMDAGQWTRFATGVAWFVARRDGRPVGLAGGMTRDERAAEPHVIGMWVQPAERRQGVAAALLTAVCDWAGERADTVDLCVADSNPAARQLYERHGFVATGECGQLPGGRGSEQRLRRLLREPGAAAAQARKDSVPGT